MKQQKRLEALKRYCYLLLLIITIGVCINLSAPAKSNMTFISDAKPYKESVENQSQDFDDGPPLSPSEQSLENEAATTEGNNPYISPIDFTVLKMINPDIIAWIQIPGTAIDYPIVQSKDNEDYLYRNIYGETDYHGSIFQDSNCNSDFQGSHHILYGHHMKDGTMFAHLLRFREESFFRDHRTILLYTPEREYRLKTIAAVWHPADSLIRKTTFHGEQDLLIYLKEMTKDCDFRELPDEPVNTLFSFVTCSYESDQAMTVLYTAEDLIP